MKIYFSGSIRVGRQDAELYSERIENLKSFGTVHTEDIGYDTINQTKTDREIHDEDIAWLKESDNVIAEVTTPSLGVGYEIGRAMDMNQRIQCLYSNKDINSVTAMIKGSSDFSC